MKQPKDFEFDSVSQMADWALESCDHDWHKSKDLMHKMMDDYPAIKAQMLEKFVDLAIWSAVRASAHRFRNKMMKYTPPMTEGKDNPEGINLLAARGWYDMAIYGGIKLGDATLEDLQTAVDEHRKQASSNLLMANFYTKIASRMPKDKIVRDVLSEADIEAMRE